jgi:hypothetical protein
VSEYFVLKEFKKAIYDIERGFNPKFAAHFGTAGPGLMKDAILELLKERLEKAEKHLKELKKSE